MSQKIIARSSLFLFAAVLGTGSAFAAEWSAASCGEEPQPPGVKAATVAAYNDSVDKVAAYEKAARAYNACVSAQANKEETAISQEASARISRIHAASTAVQSRIASSFQTLTKELTAAQRKLGAH